MNEKEFNKGIQDLKNISLSKTEKEAMLSHISTYADFHTPKVKVTKKHSFLAFMHMHSPIAYSALGFIFIVSSTVYGAEKALPGDILYPFKIHVNESIQSAIITDIEAQARWESERFVRRIEEAEILATKGRLDEATLLEVESRIDKHFEKLEELAGETPAPEAVIAEAPTMMMQAKSAPEPIIETARIAGDATESPAGDIMMFATFAIEDTSVIEIEKDEFELEIEKHRAILQSIKGDDDKLNERLDRLDRKLSEKARKRAEKKANVQIITPAERIDDNSNDEIEVEIEDESNDDTNSDDGANVFESQRQRGKNKER